MAMLELCKREGACLLLLDAARRIKMEGCQMLFRENLFSPLHGLSVGRSTVRLLKAKRKSNRREEYVESLRGYLRRFIVGRSRVPIAAVTTEQIASYLERHSGNSYATNLNRISTLFAFAVQQRWISYNPCDRIERPTIDRKPPRVLTPDEAWLLVQRCSTVCRPYLLLALFCGIRPTEVQRLNWSDINHATKTVTINSAASKVHRRRVVNIPECAATLLANHPVQSGPVSPSAMTLRRCKRKFREILGDWPADILRHTCASYSLALSGDAGKVATQLGNSPKILLTHYNGLASREDAEQFFKV